MKIISLIAFTLFLSACNASKEEDTAANNERMQNGFIHLNADQTELSEIRFGKIKKQVIHERIRCSGIIDVPPQNKASISASMSGRVSALNFYPGDRVAKGEVLCALRDAQYIQMQEDYLNALQEEIYLEQELERKKSLIAASAISDKELLKASNLYKKAKIRRESLVQKLHWLGFNPEEIRNSGIQAELLIRSPINGFITEMNVNLGKQLDASALLYEIVDPAHLHLELQVYQKDLSKIKEGQIIEFRFPDDTATYRGEVFLLGQKVDVDSRKVRVHGHFDSEELSFKPGALFKAEVLVAKDTAFVLPEGAFSDAFGSSVIYFKDQGGIRRATVEKGIIDEGMVALNNFPDSLKDKQFVVNGAFYLTESDAAGHDH